MNRSYGFHKILCNNLELKIRENAFNFKTIDTAETKIGWESEGN